MLAVRSVASAALALSLSLLAGCAVEANPEAEGEAQSTEQSVVSAVEPGIDVEVKSRLVLIDTPTYGYYPTAPFVSVRILVEDAKLRATRPGFDGYERPFVLLPRADGPNGQVRWERQTPKYKGVTLRGYYAERRLDMYELDAQRMSEADFKLAREHGIAVGMDTNVGTIWAQTPGKNFEVYPAVQ